MAKPVTDTGDKRSISPIDSKSTRSSKRLKIDASQLSIIRQHVDVDKGIDSDDDTASDEGQPSSAVVADNTTSIDVASDNKPYKRREAKDVKNVDSYEQSTDRPSDVREVGRNVKGVKLSFVPPQIGLMPRIVEKGFRYDGVRKVDNIPFCKLEDYFATSQSKALRLLRYSASGVGHNMTSIFVAVHDNYSRIVLKNNSLSRRVVSSVDTAASDRYRVDSTFFLIGRVVNSNLLHNAARTQYSRDLSIQPIHRFLPRIISSIGSLLDFKRPAFVITHDGLNFSTMRKPGDNRKTPAVRDTVMNGVKHGPSPRSWDEDVPLFDGRALFQLTNYDTLTRLDQDMNEGDFALVAFTLGGWIDSSIGPLDPKSQRVALNIQFAILLERPVENDKHGVSSNLTDDLRCEDPLGVTDVTHMKPLVPKEHTEEELQAQAHLISPVFDGLAM